jgi:hypothetical protein
LDLLVGRLRGIADAEAGRLYALVFEEVGEPEAKAVSRREREDKALLGTGTLVYGEITWSSFAEVLRRVSPRPRVDPSGAAAVADGQEADEAGSVGGGCSGCGTGSRSPATARSGSGSGYLDQHFVDLGSGCGKPCVAAALLCDYARFTGIEILEGLHMLAVDALARYRAIMHAERRDLEDRLAAAARSDPAALAAGGADADDAGASEGGSAAVRCFPHLLQSDLVPASISFYAGSFLPEDLPEAEEKAKEAEAVAARVPQWWLDRKIDLIFANSTCFTDELINELGLLAACLRPGVRFVSFTRNPECEGIDLVWSRRLLQSWGLATVHISLVMPSRRNTGSGSSLVCGDACLEYAVEVARRVSADTPPLPDGTRRRAPTEDDEEEEEEEEDEEEGRPKAGEGRVDDGLTLEEATGEDDYLHLMGPQAAAAVADSASAAAPTPWVAGAFCLFEEEQRGDRPTPANAVDTTVTYSRPPPAIPALALKQTAAAVPPAASRSGGRSTSNSSSNSGSGSANSQASTENRDGTDYYRCVARHLLESRFPHVLDADVLASAHGSSDVSPRPGISSTNLPRAAVPDIWATPPAAAPAEASAAEAGLVSQCGRTRTSDGVSSSALFSGRPPPSSPALARVAGGADHSSSPVGDLLRNAKARAQLRMDKAHSNAGSTQSSPARAYKDAESAMPGPASAIFLAPVAPPAVPAQGSTGSSSIPAGMLLTRIDAARAELFIPDVESPVGDALLARKRRTQHQEALHTASNPTSPRSAAVVPAPEDVAPVSQADGASFVAPMLSTNALTPIVTSRCIAAEDSSEDPASSPLGDDLMQAKFRAQAVELAFSKTHRSPERSTVAAAGSPAIDPSAAAASATLEPLSAAGSEEANESDRVVIHNLAPFSRQQPSSPADDALLKQRRRLPGSTGAAISAPTIGSPLARVALSAANSFEGERDNSSSPWGNSLVQAKRNRSLQSASRTSEAPVVSVPPSVHCPSTSVGSAGSSSQSQGGLQPSPTHYFHGHDGVLRAATRPIPIRSQSQSRAESCAGSPSSSSFAVPGSRGAFSASSSPPPVSLSSSPRGLSPRGSGSSSPVPQVPGSEHQKHAKGTAVSDTRIERDATSAESNIFSPPLLARESFESEACNGDAPCAAGDLSFISLTAAAQPLSPMKAPTFAQFATTTPDGLLPLPLNTGSPSTASSGPYVLHVFLPTEAGHEASDAGVRADSTGHATALSAAYEDDDALEESIASESHDFLGASIDSMPLMMKHPAARGILRSSSLGSYPLEQEAGENGTAIFETSGEDSALEDSIKL